MLRRAAIATTLLIAACPGPGAAPHTDEPRTDEPRRAEPVGDPVDEPRFDVPADDPRAEAPREPPPRDEPPPARPGLDATATGLLAAHNRVRAAHCAPPLVWSPALAAEATAWADALAANACAFEHSSSPYGENLAGGTASALGPDEVVAMWSREVSDYDFRRPRFGMTTGHFTQVVWKGTTQLGCGVATCSGQSRWVCNYDPPGNVAGDFPANVAAAYCPK